ncbi:hypothetical protein FACS189430_08930 [Bacteroidia bacterium]|nr:hypothetical protein FACS189430_08930 [Bacteroidia bacterium]
METMLIQVDTKQDADRLMEISEANGKKIQSRNRMLQWLIETAPKNVPLTDEDIMAEIRDKRMNE